MSIDLAELRRAILEGSTGETGHDIVNRSEFLDQLRRQIRENLEPTACESSDQERQSLATDLGFDSWVQLRHALQFADLQEILISDLKVFRMAASVFERSFAFGWSSTTTMTPPSQMYFLVQSKSGDVLSELKHHIRALELMLLACAEESDPIDSEERRRYFDDVDEFREYIRSRVRHLETQVSSESSEPNA